MKRNKSILLKFQFSGFSLSLQIPMTKHTKKMGKRNKKSPDLKVMDKGKYYDCTIVDRAKNRIRVHYMGWSSTMDEWIDNNSDRLYYGAGGVSESNNMSEEVLESCCRDSAGTKRRRDSDDEPSSEAASASSKRRCSQMEAGPSETLGQSVNLDAMN